MHGTPPNPAKQPAQRPTLLVWYGAGMQTTIGPLAKELHDSHGVDTVLMCVEERLLRDPKSMGLNEGGIARIIQVAQLLQPRSPSELPSMGALAEAATALERRLGFAINDVIRCDRHLGLGFVTGADFARSQYGYGLTFAQITDLVLRQCQYFETVLNELRPIAILGYPGMILSASLIHVATALGIPFRNPIKSRDHAELFQWSRDKQWWWYGLEEAYATRLAKEPLLPPASAPDSSMPMAFRMQVALKKMRTNTTLRGLLRELSGVARRELYRRRSGAGKYGHYLPQDFVRLVVLRWFWRKRLLREKAVVDALPADTPFVFFAPQTEPEASFMVEATMCDNQLACIDWLAKTLPGGWLLVVKEHPGSTALRPKGFWERVRAYPNVVVAATLESAEGIARRARAVAVISSTVGVQAALEGTPVITFHPEFQVRMLPHVLLAESYTATRRAMNRIRDNDLPEMAERLRSARAFRAALTDVSFAVEDEGMMHGVPGRDRISANDARTLASTLLATLGSSGGAAANGNNGFTTVVADGR